MEGAGGPPLNEEGGATLDRAGGALRQAGGPPLDRAGGAPLGGSMVSVEALARLGRHCCLQQSGSSACQLGLLHQTRHASHNAKPRDLDKD